MSFNGKSKLWLAKNLWWPGHGTMSYHTNHTVEASSGSFFPFLFLRPGIMEESILFDVDRIRMGKVFC